MKNNISGMSLIELLVVITIIGILTSIAVPTYSNYVIKAQATELIVTANSYKLDIIEDSIVNQEASFAAKDLPLYSPNLDKVTLRKRQDQDGSLYVLDINSKIKTALNESIKIQLQGRVTGNSIVWDCHTDAKFVNYLPKSCVVASLS